MPNKNEESFHHEIGKRFRLHGLTEVWFWWLVISELIALKVHQVPTVGLPLHGIVHIGPLQLHLLENYQVLLEGQGVAERKSLQALLLIPPLHPLRICAAWFLAVQRRLVGSSLFLRAQFCSLLISVVQRLFVASIAVVCFACCCCVFFCHPVSSQSYQKSCMQDTTLMEGEQYELCGGQVRTGQHPAL